MGFTADLINRVQGMRQRGAVCGAVSPGKVRHRSAETAAPTPGFPRKADKLTVSGWLSV